MRWCKIALGPGACKQPGGPCCKDCADKTCQARCWNDPKRCACWSDEPCRGVRPLPKKRGVKPSLDREEIVRLYKSGLLQYQIALRLGCSTSGVSKVLREMGVTGHGKS